MTMPIVPSITDEQLAELEAVIDDADNDYPQKSLFSALIERIRTEQSAARIAMDMHNNNVDRLRAAETDAKRYRWLAHRPRWASAHVDFDKTGTYREHRVVWFTGDDWPHATGQTLDAAIDAAMERKECT